MNSTSIKIKKFFSNKNTVTIICAIIGIVVLFVGYQFRVKSAIQPQRIPYAKVNIQPRTKITDDMIGYINVPQAAVDEMGANKLIKDETNIIDHYSNINTMIPAGSLFYEGAVVNKSDLPDEAVYDVPKGETLYYLQVNMATSYVNSIVPGGFIDLYIRTNDRASGQVRVGKFIENIKVMAVKDANGYNVFENSDERRVPAYVLFSVPNKAYTYLSEAATLGLTIVPVPVNVSESEGIAPETSMTSAELLAYIDTLASEYIQDDVDLTQDKTDKTNKTN